jgi:hypothetical protein
MPSYTELSQYSLHELKADALESCELYRDHDMGPWEPVRNGTGATSDCVRCGRGVTCLTRPRPNETYIAGEAVASDCGLIPQQGDRVSTLDGREGILIEDDTTIWPYAIQLDDGDVVHTGYAFKVKEG